LLAKHEFRQALALIEDAIAAGNHSPSVLRLKVRALGGWAELGDDGRIRVVPGLGRAKEAYDLLWGSRKQMLAKHRPYTLEWYRFYFDCMDLALKRAASGNTDFARIAPKFRSVARSVDNFATLGRLGDAGRRLRRLFSLRR